MRNRVAVVPPGLLAVLSLLTIPTAALAQRPWWEARSPHFVVVTDEREGTARTLAWEFEQVRAAVGTLAPWAQFDGDGPMLILAAQDEDGLKALVPRLRELGRDAIASYSASGPDRRYIALRTDLRGENRGLGNPYQSAYWSYANAAIMRGSRRALPLWLPYGLAGLMSNMLVRENEIQLGRLPQYYLTRANQGERLLLPELLRVDRASPWATQQQRRATFDAQSAAFVHFLLFGSNGAHRPRLDKFLQAILSGTSIADATAAIFGDAAQLQEPFFLHVARPVLEFMQIKANVNIRAADFTLRRVPPAELAAMQAGLLVATNHPEDARARIAGARKIDPNRPDSYEVEGVLLDREKQTEQARTAYARAVELGSTHFYPYYRLAALAMTPPSPEGMAQAEQYLERSVALNDAYLQALVQLGNVKANLRKTDEAVAAYTRAATLDPSSSLTRRLLAGALMSAGRRDDALVEAQEAAALAQTPQEQQAAAQLVQRLQTTAPGVR